MSSLLAGFRRRPLGLTLWRARADAAPVSAATPGSPRLERDSGVTHQPLRALDDQLPGGFPRSRDPAALGSASPAADRQPGAAAAARRRARTCRAATPGRCGPRCCWSGRGGWSMPAASSARAWPAPSAFAGRAGRGEPAAGGRPVDHAAGLYPPRAAGRASRPAGRARWPCRPAARRGCRPTIWPTGAPARARSLARPDDCRSRARAPAAPRPS